MEPLETLRGRITAAINELTDTVARGNARDMEAYVRMTSRIRTLQDMLEEITEIEARYLDE